MKKIIFTLVVALIATTFLACSSDNNNDQVIEYASLPENARAFMNQHLGSGSVEAPLFDESQIAKVEKEHDGSYEIKLKNGMEIDFNADGAIIKIDLENNQITNNILLLLPTKTLEYLNQTYSPNGEKGIEEIEYKLINGVKQIEIELRNIKHDIYFNATTGEIIKDSNKGINDGPNKENITTITELPQPAQDFLKDHFDGLTVKKIEKDAKGYEINYSDAARTEVEFDLNGNFKSVEVEVGSVPTSVMLPKIAQYLSVNYAEKRVEEYGILASYHHTVPNGYKVEIDTTPFDLEVYFSAEGAFIKEVVDY